MDTWWWQLVLLVLGALLGLASTLSAQAWTGRHKEVRVTLDVFNKPARPGAKRGIEVHARVTTTARDRELAYTEIWLDIGKRKWWLLGALRPVQQLWSGGAPQYENRGFAGPYRAAWPITWISTLQPLLDIEPTGRVWVRARAVTASHGAFVSPWVQAVASDGDGITEFMPYDDPNEQIDLAKFLSP